ncbi:MAG: glycosyltransferase [Nocardioidaceae bacterium]
MNRFVQPVGGAESYMFSLAALQRAAGHEVETFGVAPYGSTAARYSAEFPKDIERRGSRPEKIRALGRMMWSTTARRGIRQVLVDFRPDVVHAHNVYHELSPSVLGPVAERNVPCVMTLHDYKLACPSQEMLAHGKLCDACLPGRYWQAVRVRCKDDSLAASAAVASEAYLHRGLGSYDVVSRFLCPSRFLADTMARARVYPERLRVVPHFIDAAQITAKSSPGHLFVYAGRLVASKGVDVLLDAIAHVPKARLVIAGEGPDGDKLRKQAAQLSLDRVSFLGHISRHEFLKLLLRARALVVPSRWYENQPMAVLEAQSVGVPVIASRLGGLSELVQDSVTGFLTAPGDCLSLASRARRLADDPIEAMRMGRTGRESVLLHFNPTDHYRRVLGAYRDAAENTLHRQHAVPRGTRTK